ncbi:DUF1552 domain-containing protein [Sandaracinus amylolyticus]|uniref:DUF1552 domain-containing protein n=1 Tax=Sandaracinus amylolyticus TaxID=927083 RepID=UPI00069EC8FD|nr:DUF1552 domain-containing protein [Sandaracinus amylolyticus]
MMRITRRRALAALGIGGGAAALFPWLARRALAGGAPRRLVLFFTPHGTVWDRWRPTGGETDFAFSPILAPIERHRERLVIVDGVRMESGTEYYIPHTYTMPLLWTGSPIDTSAGMFCRDDHGGRCFGWNTGVSVDQHIASRLPSTTPYRTIELGFRCGGAHPASRMIYTGASMPKTPVDDPRRAWTTLFGSVMTDADAIRRRSVLDTVHKDFATRRARLSSSDRARLDAHASALEELERTLVPPSAVCDRPTEPTFDDETAIDRQSDLLAAALGCGLTDVASFQLRIADNDNSLYPWTGLASGGHHTLSHDSGPDAQATLAALYTWYSDRFAYLLDRLAATPDVDGTSVLDNTLVIWGSELGRAWDHDISNIPFVLAGGAVRGGRYLRVSDMQLNRVLVTACHAMGLNDVETYGSLDRGAGALPGVLGA